MDETGSRGVRLTEDGQRKLNGHIRSKNLTYPELSKLCKVSSGTIRNVRKRSRSDWTSLFSIFEALGLTLEETDYEFTDKAAKPIPWNIPYGRNEYFTGREEIFGLLKTALAKAGASALTQAISGLGGVGKTQTAVEYAYRCRDRRRFHSDTDDCADYPTYTAYLWARADTEPNLIASYVEIARTLQLFREEPSEQPLIVQAVVAWLANPANAGYLLVLDNADTPDILPPFLPDSRRGQRLQGAALLTSRTENLRRIGIAHPIALPVLTPTEAVGFLYASTGRDAAQERERAEELAHELGYLPLALEQAAAYISLHNKSFAEYLALYRQLALKLLEQTPPEMGDYPHTVRTTWELNFQEIERHYPLSAEALRFCAFLAPDAIPMELTLLGITDYDEAYDTRHNQRMPFAEASLLYDEVIEPLARYSLLQKNEGYTCSIHRMVQTVLHDRMDAEERQRKTNKAIATVAICFPKGDYENWERCERYLAHALHCTEHIEREEITTRAAGLLCQKLGYYLYIRGQYELAEWLNTKTAHIYTSVLPEEHPEIAASLISLAALYQRQGRYEEAEPLNLRALKALPERHPYFATSLHNLAQLYIRQGRYEEAEPLCEKALEMWKQSLGEAHPDVATSLNNLAALYDGQGRYKEAEQLFLQALAIRQQVLSEGHPDMAQSLGNLALLYQRQGRYEEAEPLYGIANGILIAALGMQHPDTQGGIQNHLICLVEMGREAEVEAMAPGFTDWYRQAKAQNS